MLKKNLKSFTLRKEYISVYERKKTGVPKSPQLFDGHILKGRIFICKVETKILFSLHLLF